MTENMREMKKILTIISVLAVTAVSCTDYLDIKPYGKTIPKTADEFASLLHYHLNEIDWGEEVIVGNINSVMDLECYADNLESILTQYPQGNFLPLYIGDHLSSKQDLYEDLYEIIRDCNLVLGYLEERDTRLGQDVLGTAYALRGVCYYVLLKNFCEPYEGDAAGKLGVPLVTEFDMEAKPLRSTFAQTVGRADEDLRTAISYDIQDPVYRFNSDVAKGYLARLHFWAGNYEKAAGYASELLQKYPLIGGEAYKAMMESEIEKTGNMIFKSYVIAESSHQLSYSGYKSTILSRPISRRFIDLFAGEETSDIRYSISVGADRVNNKCAFACLRSAELQLIMMESYYHMGRETDALSALNELRRFRVTGVTDYTMETLPPVNADDIIKQDAEGNALTPLIYAILCERRKELYMEGDRWYELKRNGRPEMWTAKNSRKFTTYSYMYTFPISIRDLELVDGLVQNPGYEVVE